MTHEIPNDLKEKQNEFLSELKKKHGKVRIGINEVTKAIERDTAKMVFAAKDVSPAEVIMHLPLLCKEKKVPFSYVDTKKELGEKVGIAVGAAAVAVTDLGESQKEFDTISKRLNELAK